MCLFYVVFVGVSRGFSGVLMGSFLFCDRYVYVSCPYFRRKRPLERFLMP